MTFSVTKVITLSDDHCTWNDVQFNSIIILPLPPHPQLTTGSVVNEFHFTTLTGVRLYTSKVTEVDI